MIAKRMFNRAVDLYANRPGIIETTALAASAASAGITYTATEGTDYKKGVDSLFAFSTVSAIAQGLSGTVLSTRAGQSALTKRIGIKNARNFASAYLISGYTSAALGAASYYHMDNSVLTSSTLGGLSTAVALLGSASAFNTGYMGGKSISLINNAVNKFNNRKN